MAKFRGSKIKARVTKNMALNYIASYKKFLEKQVEEQPDVTVQELIDKLDRGLKEEGYEPPEELEDCEVE